MFSVLLLSGAVAGDPVTFLAPPSATQSTVGSPHLLPTYFDTPRSLRCSAAIDKAVTFLEQRQRDTGCWQDLQPQDSQGGQTALVTLALLSSGMSHQSDSLLKAVDYLHRTKPDQTYSVALRACVYAQLPEAIRSPQLRADVTWLEKAMIKKQPNDGMYTYGNGINDSIGDYSNSQYGVLGVWYAAEAGVDVPNSFWRKVESAWLKGQGGDGGWGYIQEARDDSYASMTAAGIATLFITNDYLHTADSLDLFHHSGNKPLDRALRWLATYFAADHNPGRDSRLRASNSDDLFNFGPSAPRHASYVPYTLFGYERVGEASGLTRFGTNRWFDQGADYLCRTQSADGSWPTIGDCSGSAEVETAYALLFLSRGRSPVAIQKLQFGTRSNNRPRDVADFINYLRYNTETHLNWQFVTPSSPASELRDAPLLYAASDRAIVLNDSEKANLRQYIERGGVLWAVNEGDGSSFARSIEQLGVELFPAYAFHPVPLSDAMYKGNFRVKNVADSTGIVTGNASIPLRSLGNGIRDFIVLAPEDDLSWKWEVASGAAIAHLNPYTAAANLWSESIGGEDPLTKGRTTWTDRNLTLPDNPRSLAITRLQFAGNWNPEPAGWERLANLLHNAGDAELRVESISLADLKPPGSSSNPIAHLTALGDVALPPAEITALRKFIDAGGLLLFDAAGGSAEASNSMQAILAGLYPSAHNEPLPIDHPIYQGNFPGGRPITAVTYRGSDHTTHLPRLRGLTLNGKLLAIISSEDLSAALVGYPRSNIPGYSPRSAAELVRAILLWHGTL